MATYVYDTDPDSFEIVHFRQQDRELRDRFCTCVRVGSNWSPPLVTVPKQLPQGDFPTLSRCIPVFSQRAWVILEPLIGSSVEVLPLRHPDPTRLLFAI